MSSMNEYESRRLEKIRANQALLAELNIKPLVSDSRRTRRKNTVTTDSRPAKKRKIFTETKVPSRTSARIAAAPVKPSYNDDGEVSAVRIPKSKVSNRKELESREVEETEPSVPLKDVESIKAGWSAWEPAAEPPIRDDVTKTLHFNDFPDFTPNKTPAEMLREGCFGGSYYRPLKSKTLGIVVEEDWREIPTEWIEGLDVRRYLTSPTYDPEVNKYKVACGQSIEEWEAAGWISHEHDVRGWFQWYTRFYRGRRCDDDERQVSRWKKCVGPTGRWRRMLLKKYVQMGVRDVFDDGEEEEGREVSPVMHQTCHHWAFEVRQEHLDEVWAGR